MQQLSCNLLNRIINIALMAARACCWGIVGCLLAVAALLNATPVSAAAPDDGSALPFPPNPSASVARTNPAGIQDAAAS